MKIIELKTPLGNAMVGSIVNDKNYSNYRNKWNEIYPNNVCLSETCCYIKATEEQLKQLNFLYNNIRYITEIKFDPENNKFEVMSNNDIVLEIVSREYSIRNKE